jgi:hypothetical protein
MGVAAQADHAAPTRSTSGRSEPISARSTARGADSTQRAGTGALLREAGVTHLSVRRERQPRCSLRSKPRLLYTNGAMGFEINRP